MRIIYCKNCNKEVVCNYKTRHFASTHNLCEDCYKEHILKKYCVICGKPIYTWRRDTCDNPECEHLYRSKAATDASKKKSHDCWKKSAETYSNNCQEKISKRLEYCKCRMISKHVFICDKCNTAWIEDTGSGGYISNMIMNKVDPCPVCGHTKMSPRDKGVAWAKNTLSKTKGYSNAELKIREFLKSLDVEFVSNDFSVLGNLELDIFIPSKSLAIEVNGVYWHSDKFKDRNYHLNKTNLCESKDIHLLQFTDYEIMRKQDIVFDKIKSYLGLNERIFARKCELKTIDFPKDFLIKNHIQGAGIVCNKNYGLFYENKLIAVGTFRRRNGKMELMRFASELGINVIGGLSRICTRAKKDLNEDIYSFADRRFTYSKSNAYSSSGFKLLEKQVPGYFYYDDKNDCIVNREKCQKHKLMKQLGYTDPENHTEKSLTEELGYLRVWDCGQLLLINQY